jgi:hypothetical protein
VTAERDQQLTLHSGWRGILLSYLGAIAVFVAGVVSVAGAGARVVPVGLLIVGIVLVIGVLADYPISTRFSVDGVQRRALVRHHLIRWDTVTAFTRARPSIRVAQRGFAPGGLTALVGRRNYLLVDRVESGGEYDRLDTLLRSWDIDLGLGMRPSDNVAPTWMYRRKRWAPERTS